jgi:hypothetical protein
MVVRTIHVMVDVWLDEPCEEESIRLATVIVITTEDDRAIVAAPMARRRRMCEWMLAYDHMRYAPNASSSCSISSGSRSCSTKFDMAITYRFGMAFGLSQDSSRACDLMRAMLTREQGAVSVLSVAYS